METDELDMSYEELVEIDDGWFDEDNNLPFEDSWDVLFDDGEILTPWEWFEGE